MEVLTFGVRELGEGASIEIKFEFWCWEDYGYSNECSHLIPFDSSRSFYLLHS